MQIILTIISPLREDGRFRIWPRASVTSIRTTENRIAAAMVVSLTLTRKFWFVYRLGEMFSMGNLNLVSML